MENHELFNSYENRMAPHREKFAKSEGIRFFTEGADEKSMRAFLTIWHGLGIYMTENVENWIRNSGEACREKGYEPVADQLCKHAAQEANHDEMMRDDFNYFLKDWNNEYNEKLNSDDILVFRN